MKVFRYRIKEGAYKKMRQMLIYPEQCFALKDGSICAITDTFISDHTLKTKEEIKANPTIYQVCLKDSPELQDALIIPDLLEELPPEEISFKK